MTIVEHDHDTELGPEQFVAERHDDTVAVALTGEFDDFNVDALDASLAALLEPSVRAVDIDTTRVTYVSSTAVRALIAFHDAATKQAAAVRITRASYVVRRLLEVVGLSTMFGLGPGGDSAG